MEITFDPKKIKIVDIDTITPNPWNPKDINTNEYKNVVKSLKKNGLIDTIKVRKLKDGYEIIDGEQKWRGCKELGYTKVAIYDFGNIADPRAKELTLWFEVKVPFDPVKESQLVVQLMQQEVGELPYSENQLDEFRRLSNFDWENFQKGKEQNGTGDGGNGNNSTGSNSGNTQSGTGGTVTCPECGCQFIPTNS